MINLKRIICSHNYIDNNDVQTQNAYKLGFDSNGKGLHKEIVNIKINIKCEKCDKKLSINNNFYN